MPLRPGCCSDCLGRSPGGACASNSSWPGSLGSQPGFPTFRLSGSLDVPSTFLPCLRGSLASKSGSSTQTRLSEFRNRPEFTSLVLSGHPSPPDFWERNANRIVSARARLESRSVSGPRLDPGIKEAASSFGGIHAPGSPDSLRSDPGGPLVGIPRDLGRQGERVLQACAQIRLRPDTPAPHPTPP